MTSETVAAVAPIAAIVRATGAGSPDRATTTRYPASTASAASTRPSRPAPMMPRVRMGEVTVTSSSYGAAGQAPAARAQWSRSIEMSSALRLSE